MSIKNQKLKKIGGNEIRTPVSSARWRSMWRLRPDCLGEKTCLHVLIWYSGFGTLTQCTMIYKINPKVLFKNSKKRNSTVGLALEYRCNWTMQNILLSQIYIYCMPIKLCYTYLWLVVHTHTILFLKHKHIFWKKFNSSAKDGLVVLSY